MRKKKKNQEQHLLTHTDPHSPVAEAYRTLRTNIQFASLDRAAKSLLVTGANPGCGKSTTVANLGVVMAQAGSAVLIVDTDLRRPSMHKFFNLVNDSGLTNFLVNLNMDLERVVRRTAVSNLYVMTSGPIPPNPAELLATNKMKHVAALFKEKFDRVIYDSPPIIAVTDAAILSRLVDATVMVLDHGGVTRDEARFALEQLQKVKANVIGAVINGMPTKGSYYNYYYYYGTGRRPSRKRRRHWSESDGITM